MGERDTDAAARIGALIIAGGKGKRLGGASKSDLELGGRLLDRVLDSLSPLTSWEESSSLLTLCPFLRASCAQWKILQVEGLWQDSKQVFTRSSPIRRSKGTAGASSSSSQSILPEWQALRPDFFALSIQIPKLKGLSSSADNPGSFASTSKAPIE